MDMQTAQDFFLWCTVINAALMLVAFVMMMFAGDLAYRIHSRWFPMPRQTFTVVIYSLMGLYKIVFIAFNVVPYAALRIIG